MEANKEQIKYKQKPNQLHKAREIYFKYFSSQKMARTKGTVQKQAMMGLPLVTSLKERTSQGLKGKTPGIGVKRLEQIKPKMGKIPSNKR